MREKNKKKNIYIIILKGRVYIIMILILMYTRIIL